MPGGVGKVGRRMTSPGETLPISLQSRGCGRGGEEGAVLAGWPEVFPLCESSAAEISTKKSSPMLGELQNSGLLRQRAQRS